MTPVRGGRYSQRVMSGLQHAGAFVIQFETGTDFERDRVSGRIEHVLSGRTARFRSRDELLSAFALLLKESVPQDVGSH